ncbi:rod shape-determining protein RodA [Candidatus Woesebacteria bacterium]|nr:rod shape-determining protein RodA [Candidatus Woesebacteria bacterium]
MRTWILPAIMLVLALLSIVVLSSIAPALAPKQTVFFLIGAVTFAVASSIPLRQYERAHWLGYIVTVLLLILTQLIGQVTRSTTSWFTVAGLFAVQPSQLAVPLIGLSVAITVNRLDMSKLHSIFKAVVLIAVPALLILSEPDLGTAAIFLGGMASLLWLSPTRFIHLFLMAALACGTIGLSWQFLAPYQKARITSFIYADDPQGAGYNARQSLIAVGSGSLTGRGLGQGSQSHLRFLPERQTDFIFASLAEEFGLIGSVLVIVLYAMLVVTLVHMAQKQGDSWTYYFCLAIAVALFLQIFVNIGMNSGLLPITGITLPLLSYGGSSVIATCGMLGIAQAIIRQRSSKQSVYIH